MYYLEAQVTDTNRPTALKVDKGGWEARTKPENWREFKDLDEMRDFIKKHPIDCQQFNICNADRPLAGFHASDWTRLTRSKS